MGSNAGQRLRSQLREEYRAQHRRIGWRYLPAIAVYCAVCSLLIAWLAWTVGGEAAWFGAGAGVGVAPLFLSVALQTPEADRLESAAITEEWASSELRKLEADGWHIHSNVSFERFDVDHVAIGPGGVVIVETKSGHDLTAPTGVGERIVRRYEQQLERSKQPIQSILKQHGSDAPVRGQLLAVGGPHRPDGPTRTSNGVRMVPIDGLAAFLSELSSELTVDEIAAADRAVSSFVEGRERKEAARV